MLISMIILTAVDSQVFLLCAVVLSSVGFIFSMSHKDIRQELFFPVISFSVLLSCVLFIFPYTSYKKAVSYTDEICTVRAVVKQTPYFSAENQRYYTTAKIKSVNGTKISSDIKLSFAEKPEIDTGNEILFDGYIYKTGASVKSIENNYKGQKLYIGSYNIQNIKITDKNINSYYYYTEKVSDYINKAFTKRFKSEVSDILIAIVTGDKTNLDDDIYNSFKHSGVAHLMAVSGLHLSVWVMFLQMILDKKSKHRILSNLFIIAVVIFIMSVASFSGSVKRAGLMCLLHLFGRMLNEKSDSLNSLGFAVTIILVINPYSVYDIGFMLSFLSTLSIITMAIPLGDKLNSRLLKTTLPDKLKPLIRLITTSLMISFSTALFTFPVIAVKFGYLSIVAPLTNILFLPVTFILILCAGMFLLFSFSIPLSTPFSLICTALSDYAIFITSRLSSFKFSSIPVGKNSVIVWIAVLLCIAVFTRFYKRKKYIVKIVVTLFCIITAFTGILNLRNSIGSYELHLIPSENNLCAVVSSGSQCVLAGYCDNYYFKETVLDIIEGNNLELRAIVSEESNKVKNFAQKCGADCLISDSLNSITLTGTVAIYINENKILIEGNNNHFEIVDCNYLQQINKYDIINYSDENHSTYDNSEPDKHKHISSSAQSYIKVRSDGTYIFGGDSIG